MVEASSCLETLFKCKTRVIFQFTAYTLQAHLLDVCWFMQCWDLMYPKTVWQSDSAKTIVVRGIKCNKVSPLHALYYNQWCKVTLFISFPGQSSVQKQMKTFIDHETTTLNRVCFVRVNHCVHCDLIKDIKLPDRISVLVLSIWRKKITKITFAL